MTYILLKLTQKIDIKFTENDERVTNNIKMKIEKLTMSHAI